MQNNQPPPYKPPAYIEQLIRLKKEQQNLPPGHRIRTYSLPKRNWIYRNPRIFQATFITVSLLIFFSKPLYDAFIADPIPAIPGAKPIPPNKR